MPTAEPDAERAVELRRRALERAGYGPEAARSLAERLDVDLRQAVALPKHGFPPEVAARMLLTGERPVF
jgi:hypothetical protein